MTALQRQRNSFEVDYGISRFGSAMDEAKAGVQETIDALTAENRNLIGRLKELTKNVPPPEPQSRMRIRIINWVLSAQKIGADDHLDHAETVSSTNFNQPISFFMPALSKLVARVNQGGTLEE